jgi:hypothetical protein
MRAFFSGVPGRAAAVILGIGALITSIGAITGFWASQILQNTEDTIVAEIVLDASRTMSEPLNPRPGDTESKWSSAKRFVLDYTATRYEASNSYIALRHFGGTCSPTLAANDIRPTVDWPATRYFFGPWRIYGGSDNQSAVRATLDSLQPSGEPTVWSTIEDAIGHLERGPSNLEKARRQLVLVYSASAVDTCHQFAIDRLAAQMSGGNIRFIPISLGEASNAPDNLTTQVAQLANRVGVQIANTSSQTQLDQALRTALPAPTPNATPTATTVAAPALAPTSPATTPTSGPTIALTLPPTSTRTSAPAITSTPRAAITPTASPTTTPTSRPTTTPTPTSSTLSPSPR